MQHSKLLKGNYAANLNDVVLWEYYYSDAQKAIAQMPRLIFAIVTISALGWINIK